jgi:hypothetical protein
MKKNDTCKTPDQGDLWGQSNPRDKVIQIYISVGLGVVAFLGFCVRPDLFSHVFGVLADISEAAPSTMERPLCRTKEAEPPGHRPPRASRQLLRLDSTAMEDQRRTDLSISWSRCVCGMSLYACGTLPSLTPDSTWLSLGWPSNFYA